MQYNYKLFTPLLLSLLITTTSLFAQIPNAGFENWHTSGNYEDPNGWGTLNSQTSALSIKTVKKATAVNDVHSGSYAIKLVSTDIPFIQVAPGLAVSGTINTNTQEFEGGFPYTQRPQKLKGWYKYTPGTGDHCQIEAYLFKRNGATQITVADATFTQSATVGSYTEFEVTLTYYTNDIPDTGRIALFASDPLNPVDGSTLIVDDIRFVDCSVVSASATNTSATCNNADGSATATLSNGTSPYTYAWNNTGNTATLSSVAAGNYTVTVTDHDGCSATASTTVSSTNTPISVTPSSTVSSCVANDGTATITPTSGTSPYTYLWNNTETTQTISNVGPGTYNVTVTDANGCSTTAQASVTTATGPSATANTTNPLCAFDATGDIDVTVTGGTAPITYTWSNAESTEDITALSAGSYSVTITDANSCSFVLTQLITQPTALGVTLSTTPATNDVLNDGVAAVSGSGGTTPYSYSWSTGGTTDSLTALGSGNYCVTLTDANGCSAAACDSFAAPSCSALNISILTTNASTSTATDGSAQATVTGANFGVSSYLWSNNNTTATASQLAPGNYCVTVVDGAQCTASGCQDVSFGTGINNLSANAVVNVYPNPVNDVLTVQVLNANSNQLSIYNVSGKLVLSQKLTGPTNYIDMKMFSNGLYVYQITDTNTQNSVYGKIQVLK